MRIVVQPDGPARTRGTLSWPGGAVPCTLGRAGVARTKREGDGATPVGRFPLRRVLYRADRIDRPPATRLPVAAIPRAGGWCDDPRHPAYNTQVELPFTGRAETLWREDGLYDLLVVLGHNDSPPVPGAGSAIFLHVAAPGLGPTEGCVAIDREALAAVLAAAAPGDTLEIEEAAS